MKSRIKFVFALLTSLGMVSFASLASAAGVATITYGPVVTDVPTMSGTMLIALAVLLALVAFRLLRNNPHSGSNLVIAVAAVTALASGAGGIKLISDAQADNVLDMSSATGGTIVIPSSGFWVISNSTDEPQTIKAIEYSTGCGPSMYMAPAEALAVNGAEPINACSISTTLAPGATDSCEIGVFCEGDET